MYMHLDEGHYTALQKDLIRRQGSALQKDFIAAALSNDKFIKFVRDMASTIGNKDIPILKEQLTENQYKEPPEDTEIIIYDTWKKIPPGSTCNASFWAEVTLRHIEEKRINAYFLAANGGSLPGGRARIEKSLSLLGNNKEVDSCVRTILRRMSGLPVVRGNKSVYSDCPFARTLWRKLLLEEIVETTKISSDKLRNILHLNQTYWEKLVELVVSRNSILGSVKVRYALIWALADVREKEPNNKLLKQSGLAMIVRLLGVRSAWQELGLLELEEIKELIEDEIFPASSY